MVKLINPRETAEFIAKISKNVHINLDAVHRVALEVSISSYRSHMT